MLEAGIAAIPYTCACVQAAHMHVLRVLPHI